eukprot:6989-Pelagomonas_calceolata.AAC.2
MQGFDAFKQSLTDPNTGASCVNLVLSCVDNYEARITINQLATSKQLDHFKASPPLGYLLHVSVPD